MNLRRYRISEHDIQSGNVMGPLLLVVFVIAIFGMILWSFGTAALFSFLGLIVGFGSFVFFWFKIAPRIWNWIIDTMAEGGPDDR